MASSDDALKTQRNLKSGGGEEVLNLNRFFSQETIDESNFGAEPTQTIPSGIKRPENLKGLEALEEFKIKKQDTQLDEDAFYTTVGAFFRKTDRNRAAKFIAKNNDKLEQKFPYNKYKQLLVNVIGINKDNRMTDGILGANSWAEHRKWILTNVRGYDSGTDNERDMYRDLTQDYIDGKYTPLQIVRDQAPMRIEEREKSFQAGLKKYLKAGSIPFLGLQLYDKIKGGEPTTEDLQDSMTAGAIRFGSGLTSLWGDEKLIGIKNAQAYRAINSLNDRATAYYYNNYPIASRVGETTGEIVQSLLLWQMGGNLFKATKLPAIIDKGLRGSSFMNKILMGAKGGQSTANLVYNMLGRGAEFGGRGIFTHTVKALSKYNHGATDEFKNALKSMPVDVAFSAFLGAYDPIGKAVLGRAGLGAIGGVVEGLARGQKGEEFVSTVLTSALFNMIRSKTKTFKSTKINRNSIINGLKGKAGSIQGKFAGMERSKIVKEYLNPFFDKIAEAGGDSKDIVFNKALKKELGGLFNQRVNSIMANKKMTRAQAAPLANKEMKAYVRDAFLLTDEMSKVITSKSKTDAKKAWDKVREMIKKRTGGEAKVNVPKELVSDNKFSLTGNVMAPNSRWAKGLNKKTKQVFYTDTAKGGSYIMPRKFGKYNGYEVVDARTKKSIGTYNDINKARSSAEYYTDKMLQNINKKNLLREHFDEGVDANTFSDVLYDEKSVKNHIKIPMLTESKYNELKPVIKEFSDNVAMGDIRYFKIYNNILGHGGADKHVLGKLTDIMSKYNKGKDSKLMISSMLGADEFVVLPKFVDGKKMSAKEFTSELQNMQKHINDNYKFSESSENMLLDFIQSEGKKAKGIKTSGETHELLNKAGITDLKVIEGIKSKLKDYDINYDPKTLLGEVKKDKVLLKELAESFEPYIEQVQRSIPKVQIDFASSKTLDLDKADDTVLTTKAMVETLFFLKGRNKKLNSAYNTIKEATLNYEDNKSVVDMMSHIVNNRFLAGTSATSRARTSGGRFSGKEFLEFLKEKKNKNIKDIFVDSVNIVARKLKTGADNFGSDSIEKIAMKQAETFSRIQNLEGLDAAKADSRKLLTDVKDYNKELFDGLAETSKIEVINKKKFMTKFRKFLEAATNKGKRIPFEQEAFRSMSVDFQRMYNYILSSDMRYKEVFEKIIDPIFADLNSSEKKHFGQIIKLVYNNDGTSKNVKEALQKGIDAGLKSSKYVKSATELQKSMKNIDLDKIIKVQKDAMSLNEMMVELTQSFEKPLGLNFEIPFYKSDKLLELEKILNSTLLKAGVEPNSTSLKTANELFKSNLSLNEFKSRLSNSGLITPEQSAKVNTALGNIFSAREGFRSDQRGYMPTIVFDDQVKYAANSGALDFSIESTKRKQNVDALLAEAFKLDTLKDPKAVYFKRYKQLFTNYEKANIIEAMSKMEISDTVKNIEGRPVNVTVPMVIKKESEYKATLKKLFKEKDLKASAIYDKIDEKLFPNLKGWYVKKEFAGVLDDIRMSNNPANIMHRLNGKFKRRFLYKSFILWKNNLVQMGMADPKSFSMIPEATKAVNSNSPIVERYKSGNLYNFAIESKESLQNIADDLKHYMGKDQNVTKIGKILGGTKNFFKMIDNGVEHAYDKLGKAAWQGDKIGRTALAMQFEKNGMSTEKAIRETQRFMAHYDRLTTGTRRNLGHVFMFPSYRIAMAKLHAQIVRHPKKHIKTLVYMTMAKLAEQALWSVIDYKPTKNSISKILGDMSDTPSGDKVDALFNYRYRQINEETGETKIASASSPVHELDKYMNRYLDTTLMANLSAFPGLLKQLGANRKRNGDKITDVNLYELIKGMAVGEYKQVDMLNHWAQAGEYALSQYFPPFEDAKRTIQDKELKTFEKILNWTGTASIYVRTRNINTLRKEIKEEYQKPREGSLKEMVTGKVYSTSRVRKLHYQLSQTQRVLEALKLIKRSDKSLDLDAAMEIIRISNKHPDTMLGSEIGTVKKFMREYEGGK